MNIRLLIPCFFLLLFPILLQAQQAYHPTSPSLSYIKIDPPNKSTTKKRIKRKTAEKSDRVPYYYRHHRKLSAAYEGYVIQLAQSSSPLRRDHALFKQFGGIYYDKLEDGQYIYCIKINFHTKKAMKKYLDQIIRPKAPDAAIVLYKKGIRKTM
ncbi:MAG: hypothetical protein AAF597_05165 [Bacteroidota bacterium]